MRMNPLSQKGLILFVLAALFFILFSSVTEAANATAVYRSNTGSCATNATNCPKIRFWNSTGNGDWSNETELPTAGSPIEWTVIRFSNVSSKRVIVTQSADGQLDGYVSYNNTDWTVTNNLDRVHNGNIAAKTRMFDVQFETSTGNALLVFGIGSANAACDLGYRILLANDTSWANNGTNCYNDVNFANDMQYTWIHSDRNYADTSNQIIVSGFYANGSDIRAWVWNNSVFTNPRNITMVSSSTTGQNFDVSCSNTAGCWVAAGTDTNGNVSAHNWTGSAWQQTLGCDPTNAGQDVTWLSLKADPLTDDLQIAVSDTGTDLDACYWTGSAWTAVTQIDADIDGTTTRLFDVAWNTSTNSTSTDAKLIWDTDTTGIGLRVRSCTPACNSQTLGSVSSYPSTGNWLSLYRVNPDPNTNVAMLGLRMNITPFGIGSFAILNTTGNFTQAGTYGNSSLTSNAFVGTTEGSFLAFQQSSENRSMIPFVTAVQALSKKLLNNSALNVTANVSSSDGHSVYTAYATVYAPNGSLFQTLALTNGVSIIYTNATEKFTTLPFGNWLVNIYANNTRGSFNDTENTTFAIYRALNQSKTITIDGNFGDWDAIVNTTDPLTDNTGPIAGQLAVHRPYNGSTSGTNTNANETYDNRLNDTTTKIDLLLKTIYNVTYQLPTKTTQGRFYTTIDFDGGPGTSLRLQVYNWSNGTYQAFTLCANPVTCSGTTSSTDVSLNNGLINSTANTMILFDTTGGPTTADVSDTYISVPGGTYDYQGITKPSQPMNASNGSVAIGTPCASNSDPYCGTTLQEFATKEYHAVALENSTTMTQVSSGTNYATMIFHFNISETRENPQELTLRWIGSWSGNGNLQVGFYNYGSSAWDGVSIISDSAFKPRIINVSNATDYINDNKMVHVLLQGGTGIGGNLITDYVSLSTLAKPNRDFDLNQVKLTNNNTHLFAYMKLNGSVNFNNASRYYRLFVSTTESGPNSTTPETFKQLPFNYSYRIQLNNSACTIFNNSNVTLSGCTFANDSDEIELQAPLSTLDLTTDKNINVTFETSSATEQYDTAPDAQSFLNVYLNNTVETPAPCDKPLTGDWNVNSTQVCNNQLINLTGNLTINGTGNLTFHNVTLIINVTYNGTYGINVSGTFFINQSNITGINQTTWLSNQYTFRTFSGSSLTLINSNVSRTGWTNSFGRRGLEANGTLQNFSGNTLASNFIGLTIYSSGNNITQNTIHNDQTGGMLYGIYILGVSGYAPTANRITSNTIRTNGTSTKGIRLETNANQTNITGNTINTWGTSSSNIGILLTTNTGNNTITANTINTNGTNNNYGIQLTTNTQNNTIQGNTIWTDGSSSSNHGILLSGTATTLLQGNLIQHNTINTQGTSTDIGIYLITNVNQTTVYNNTITTKGTNDNYGINFLIQVGNNTITGNTINTAGTSTNYGIYLTTDTINNAITGNTIWTDGTINNNFGIYLLGTATTLTDGNIIQHNTIHTNGTASNYGIYLSTYVNKTTLQNNTITTQGRTGGNNYGIYLTTDTINNSIQGNTINTNGTDTDYGIYLSDSADGNVIQDAYVNTTQSPAVVIESNHSVLYNVTAISNSSNGIQLSLSAYNNTINSSYGYSETGIGIYLLQDSHNNNISHSTGNSTRGAGVRTGSYNNTFINLTALTRWGQALYFGFANATTVIDLTARAPVGTGVFLAYSNNITILGGMINASNGFNFTDASNDNNFIDVNLTNTTAALDVFFKSTAAANSVNTTFLNVTFRKTNITYSCTGVCTFNVKWWLNVKVNTSDQTSLQNANVTIRDVNIAQRFTELTDTNGQIVIKNITEYTQTALSTTPLTNYTMNATSPDSDIIELETPTSPHRSFNLTQSTYLFVTFRDTCQEPLTGEWNVNSTQICRNKIINLTGNLTINGTGNLTFHNVTLIMNTTYNGSSMINISGYATINQSNITGINQTASLSWQYAFITRVKNAGPDLPNSITIINSHISRTGWNDALGQRGLELNNTPTNFSGNNITNSFIGLTIYSSNTYIQNSNITGNKYAIYSTRTGDSVTNLTVLNNNIEAYSAYGIYFNTNVNNSLLQRNTITTSGNTANNYGIYLFTQVGNNTITGNTINTNGTGSNYGIYLQNTANNNNLTGNTINTEGGTAASNNYGIYLTGTATTPVISNLIQHNVIKTNGTATNYGVYLTGNANNTLIQNNTITTLGRNGANNYGIYLQSYVGNNTLTQNTINTNGTTDNYGIYLSTISSNNNLTGNTINTEGSTATSNSYGIYLRGIDQVGFAISPSINNLIQHNAIKTNGTDTNYGIYFFTSVNHTTTTNNTITTLGRNGANNHGIILSTNTGNNTIAQNTINTNGTTDNYGIYLTTNTINNNLSGNTINTEGSTATSNNYGIYLLGTSTGLMDGNIIQHNTFKTNGTTTNYGIHLNTNVNATTIANNTIITQGRTGTNNHGIYLKTQTGNNSITGNTILAFTPLNTQNNYGIILEDTSNNNTIASNNITVNGSNSYAINITQSNYTNFTNTLLSNTLYNPGNWITTDSLSLANFTNTTFDAINGSINYYGHFGINITQKTINQSNVNLTFNRTYVNSTYLPFLNTSAQITLRNVSFATNPQVLVDYNDQNNFVNCPTTICNNISINGGTFIFNVTSFTTYAVINGTTNRKPDNASPNFPAPGDQTFTNRTPFFNWTNNTNPIDPNGDTVTYHLQIALDSAFSTIIYQNNSIVHNYFNYPAELDFTTYFWRVRANDSYGLEGDFNGTNFTLVKSVDINLTANMTIFGFMNLSGNNDTSDNDPPPFTLQNIGNYEVNISINSTQLWRSAGLNQSNYMYKANDTQGCTSCFDKTNSITTYTNMTGADSIMFLNTLNHTTNKNTASVDINVTVPVNEPPGITTATVLFVARNS